MQQAHLATEKMLEESGLKYTSIREGIYADMFPLFLNWYPRSTDLYLPTLEGRIAYASRRELGEATARLMLRDVGLDAEKVVLLTGPKTSTFSELAEVISRTRGERVVIHKVSFDEYVAKNADGDEGGKPRQFFEAWKSHFEGIETGDAEEVDPLMEELLGRRPKSGEEVVEELLMVNMEYTWHHNYRK